MNLVETVNRNEGFASVIALANGKRPHSKFYIDSVGKTHRSEIRLVPSWTEGMRKHFTSGSKLPKWEHTQVLKSKRGAWLMEFVSEGKRVNLSMIYVDSRTMKETSFDNIIIQGTLENHAIIIPSMDTDKSKMLGELLSPNGALSKAFFAGMRRLLDPAWESLYDWTSSTQVDN